MRASAARGSTGRCGARPGSSPASSTARSCPDGGHASRNPRVLVDLLFDLLPLRQMFASREVDTPGGAATGPIDRMLPMLRLFRHGDGTLSHFNGMGVTAADQLATLLMYDDMRSQPIHHAPHSGYERLEAGRLAPRRRCGGLPADPSIGGSRGELPRLRVLERPAAHHRELRPSRGTVNDAVAQAARSTPAHSTASIGDESCCRFLAPEGRWLESRIGGWLKKRLGPVAFCGPSLRHGRAQRARPGASPRSEPRRLPAPLRAHPRAPLALSAPRASGSRARTCSTATRVLPPNGSRDPLPPRARHQAEPRADRADDRPGAAQPGGLAFRGERGRGLARGQRLLLGHRRSPADGADRAPGPPGRDAEPAAGASSGPRRPARPARSRARPLRSRREILQRRG